MMNPTADQMFPAIYSGPKRTARTKRLIFAGLILRFYHQNALPCNESWVTHGD